MCIISDEVGRVDVSYDFSGIGICSSSTRKVDNNCTTYRVTYNHIIQIHTPNKMYSYLHILFLLLLLRDERGQLARDAAHEKLLEHRYQY